MKEIAGEIRGLGNHVGYTHADVNNIERGDWHYDEGFIGAVLRQVRFNKPERVARLIKDIEKISSEIKEIMKLED